MITGMMTFNIPLWFWFKNKPMVDEMKIGGEAAAGRYQDKQNEIHARAETLLAKIEKTRELFSLYRDRLIPQTELALETALARYRTSTIEFMPVIDTARMLLDLRKKLIAVKQEYYMSYSELHSLMGNEVLP